MTFMSLALFFVMTAMAPVHPVSKKVHGYEHDEDEYRKPVFP
jgi:hypothetical protein